MSEGMSSAEFINRSDPNLQKSIDNSVISHQRKLQREKKENPDEESNKFNPNNKEDRTNAHLTSLEKLTDDDLETQQRKIDIFKHKFVYPNVLIDKNNVPDSYFELQLRIDKEKGNPDDFYEDGIKNIEDINQETRKKAGETIYNDQKKSLDNWFDYLSSFDVTYDSWFKYYTLKNIVKLGNYDKKKKQFSKRSKDTVSIFPDLNREALSFTYDVIKQRHLEGKEPNTEELKKVVDSANFGKIYAYAIDKVTPASKENKEKTEGEWTKFEQGSDHIPLYESLQGHGTGWCTAGEEVAKNQLQNGDFYVYYSKDEKGQNIIPRIAIRIKNDQVFEVRGIDLDQNMEDNMLDIAKEKYKQLPGGEKFEKKDHDMKLLTLIDNKVNSNEELIKEELLFLYELSNRIRGFGWERDPRIEEIKDKRNFVSDFNFIFEGVDHYNNDLIVALTSAKGLNFPKTINGNLNLNLLTSTEGLNLPENIKGNLYLFSLTSTEGLNLPENIKGSIRLNKITLNEKEILRDKYPNLNIESLKYKG